MQANGAEMMRIAMIQMVKEGIEVCAPVHDALGKSSEITLLLDHKLT